MVFTPRAKRVIELAFEEARQLNHNYIGTEHLLLGLIREGEGVAARVLTNLGVDPAKVRVQTTSLLAPRASRPRRRGRARPRRSTPTAATSPQLARDNKLDPVIGRNNEIERVIQILSRRTKNNPALIGEPGVGKTAIAEGLAQRVIKGDIPEPLRERRVITLDLAGLVAGTKYRGEFEERMKRVMDEIRGAAGEIILFIDELHTLVGAGAAEGAIDASNIIKPALARGELQCIGATTLNEFRKHIEKDSALERRFQPVMVGEPSVRRDDRNPQGSARPVRSAPQSARSPTRRWRPPRSSATATLPIASCPTKPSTSSTKRARAFGYRRRFRRRKSAKPTRSCASSSPKKRRSSRIRSSTRRPRFAIARRSCASRSSALEQEWPRSEPQADEVLKVTAENIAEIVASWTSIPVSRLAQAETEKLLKMKELLHERIIGQDEAVEVITRAIRRSRAGLKNPKPPDRLVHLPRADRRRQDRGRA